VLRLVLLVVLPLLVAACTAPEDPARVKLRTRLELQQRLSAVEIADTFDEVNRALQGKTVRIVRDATTTDLDEAEREVVLGMLTDRIGVFDEGLRTNGEMTVRIFNAPGRSANPEVEASRRLFVDTRTFLPRRFEFAYAFPSPDDYAFEVTVN